MHKNKSMWILVAAISLLLVTSTAFAAPKVTKVDLGTTAVNAGHYAVVFNSNSNNPNGNGVWIDPGNTSGDSTTNPTGAAATGGQTATPAEMFGLSSGYGQMLLSVDAGAGYGTEMGAQLNANKPTNVNETIFGAATGPVNKNNLELGGASAGDRAIDAGTEVTFTVDMNGEPPHLVAVMGGTAPTVTFNSTTDILTVKTTTFGTTTNAAHTFYSIVGFMILTDTATMGATPLKIIAQTNAWVGDMFPLLPGFDTSAAVSDIGGDKGTITAKCGTTIYGPTGQQRDIRIFFPDSAIATMFGSGVTSSSLAAFVGSGENTGATIATGQANFGTTGTLATFIYTFASPKDTSVGVTSSGGGSSGCFIGTAR